MSDEKIVAPKEAKGIKESLEILKGLRIVVPAGVEVMSDGKLSAKDIKPVVEAIKKYDVVVEAVKNGGEAILEAKDYDMAELALIGAETLELIKDIKAAFAAGK